MKFRGEYGESKSGRLEHQTDWFLEPLEPSGTAGVVRMVETRTTTSFPSGEETSSSTATYEITSTELVRLFKEFGRPVRD